MKFSIFAFLANSVFVAPGHKVDTVTPVPESSALRAFEKLKTYAFVAQYTASMGQILPRRTKRPDGRK